MQIEIFYRYYRMMHTQQLACGEIGHGVWVPGMVRNNRTITRGPDRDGGRLSYMIHLYAIKELSICIIFIIWHIWRSSVSNSEEMVNYSSFYLHPYGYMTIKLYQRKTRTKLNLPFSIFNITLSFMPSFRQRVESF